MNRKNIGLGVILLSVGVIMILFNMGLVGKTLFDSLFALWPLILIVIGVNIIFKNNVLVKATSWVIFVAIVVSYSFIVEPKYTKGFGFDFDFDWGNSNKITRVKHSEKYNSDTKNGKFSVSLGAANINIGTASENLFDAEVPSNVEYKKVDYKDGYESVEFGFEKNNYSIFNFDNKYQKCDFKLNKNVIWDMEIDTGATNGRLDMSALKVKDLVIDTGAANMDLVFGAGYDKTKVDIDAGATNINVTVPKTLGVRINFDDGFNKTNLKKLGWEKEDGVYESPNYDEAESKIEMDVDMGASKFDVLFSE